MLRSRLNDALKQALRNRDRRTAATLRLVLAALKDRDIAARGSGKSEGVDDKQIYEMLQKMARQNRESAEAYAKAGREDLAEKERQEIEIIESFLPKQFDDQETRQAVDGVIDELEADSIKDMGRVMGALKERYAGQMDFARASSIAKQRLGA
jgi:uncharacterized protein YqeY